MSTGLSFLIMIIIDVLVNVHYFGLYFVRLPFVRANPSPILLHIFIINLITPVRHLLSFNIRKFGIELRQVICSGRGQDLKGETGIAKDH